MKSLVIIFAILASAFIQRVNAQENKKESYSKFSLTAGWGHYELINAGIQWNYSKRSSLSTYVGSNLGLNHNTSWAFGLSFDQVFFKPSSWKIKPGYSIGALAWTRDDDLYYFKSISLPIMILVAYPISPSLTARIESGVVFTSVSDSDRKQNVEAGYPDRYNANVRINIVYKLKRK
jgi:hypothetical protein